MSDIIDLIKTDHRELEDYFGRYKSASNMEEGKKWFNQFLWEICRHSVAEEVVLYNMMESINDRGKELGEKSREDHRKLKMMLEDLRKEKDDDAFDKKFEDVFKNLMDHIKMEEVEDLAFIQENVSLEKRQSAGKMFSMKKHLVPTRPHPEIPDKPTALELALGLLVTPFDKLRDMFTSFPDMKSEKA
jgi:hemerythrin superfamily protein